MKELVLAIDAGGTAVKVVAFDQTGVPVAIEHADVETSYLPNGFVERDPTAFWQAIAAAIRQLLSGKVSAKNIVAIGCTGFGNGIFLLDKNGKPTRPGIVSVDQRAQPIVDSLVKQGRSAEISSINGQRAWGGQTLYQLLNIAQNEPDVYQRTQHALACKDYIRYCLSGNYCTDPTDASGGGLMDISRGVYAEQVFDSLGINGLEKKLPSIAANSDITGHVSKQAAAETGLSEGTPIAGSMMDVAACTLGAGVTSTDRLVMIAGTWGINCIESSGITDGNEKELPILNMLHRNSKTRLLAEGSPASAGSLNWYIDRAISSEWTFDDVNRLVAECNASKDRCYFLPFVHGPSPRRGAFLGLQASDNSQSMLRAIYEGVAFQHRIHAEELLKFSKSTAPEVIRLSGGASKSDVWAQIFSDATGRPVEVSGAVEVGALGVAMCAAVAVGLYPSLREASASMSSVKTLYTPSCDLQTQMDTRYQQFKRLDQQCLDLFSDS